MSYQQFPYEPEPQQPTAHELLPVVAGQPHLTAILDAEVANHVRVGWAVESRSETMAVVVSASRTNHVLHLLLTLLTCGFWGILWLLIAVTSRTSRVALVVNPDGTVTRTQH